jgi:hypothetical protein
VAGCFECGDGPSGSGATELVPTAYVVLRRMSGKNHECSASKNLNKAVVDY